MVTAKESQMLQQFSYKKPPDLDYMALLQQEQNHSLPCFLPISFSNDVSFPGRYASDRPPRNIPSINGGNSYLKGSQCALPQRSGTTSKQADGSCAPLKRFLIFDQSGNQTRLFFGPSFPPQNDQNIVSKTPARFNGLYGKMAARINQQFLVKPEEKWDKSNLADEKGEMLENSDEIDALLDSDSDDEFDNDDDDTDDENDEVTSTEHTPLIIVEGHDKNELVEEFMEEVASSDDSPKRRRLLDGRCMKKSSFMRVNVKLNSSCTNNDDAESNCAGEDNLDWSKRETKVKIHNTLKIIDSIIPGSKSNDPLSVIDKAIFYLKTMKNKAEALGLGDPTSASATFS